MCLKYFQLILSLSKLESNNSKLKRLPKMIIVWVIRSSTSSRSKNQETLKVGDKILQANAAHLLEIWLCKTDVVREQRLQTQSHKAENNEMFEEKNNVYKILLSIWKNLESLKLPMK